MPEHSLDNLTHTLFGATLARAAFGAGGRGTTSALLLASNAPDIDIVAAAGGTLNYLAWHRGPTHGPLGIIGLGIVVALIVWIGERTIGRRPRPTRASFGGLVGTSMIGLLGHVMMDLPTSYGTRLFSPFDWHWYASDLMPIVDVYLLGVLAAGLVVGRRLGSDGRNPALVVLAVMMLNYGVRAVGHQRALSLSAQALGPRLPEPCPDAATTTLLTWWPRESPVERRERAAHRCLVEIGAIPTLLSPLRWHTIARLSDSYQTLEVNLLDGTPSTFQDAPEAAWRKAHRYPDQWTPSVLQAAQGTLGRVFLDFSRFPATSSVVEHEDRTRVSWTDLRFTVPEGPPPWRGPRNALFSAVVIVNRSGEIVTQRLGE